MSVKGLLLSTVFVIPLPMVIVKDCQSTSMTTKVRSHYIPRTNSTSPNFRGKKFSTIIISLIVRITPLHTPFPLTVDYVPMITPKWIVSTIGSFSSSTILYAIKLWVAPRSMSTITSLFSINPFILMFPGMKAL